LSGYQLMIANKYGGYQYNDDPRASAIYSTTTGTGGAGGSFTFSLYLPLEVVARDALGDLPNRSSSSEYQLFLTVNTEASVYSTSPTAAPTFTVTIHEDGYPQPKATDLSGNPLQQTPPQLGTVQNWLAGTYNALNGAQQVTITQATPGYPVRNLIAINYDVSAGTRATGDSDWPTSTVYMFNTFTMQNVTKTTWKDQMSRQYGFTSTTADTANGLENGVYALPFDTDFGLQDGAELRTSYLANNVGDTFQLQGTFNGNSNMQWLTNYVAPAAGGNNAASIQAA
jgi:hypothetical protein